MHKFYFNGHWSDEFGIRIESPVPLTRPARKFQSASVMGRNGNIYQMQDAFDEVIVAYKIFAGEPRKGANVPSFTEIMEWLHGENGYSVLKDTYDLEHYRKAVFVDAVEIENVRTMWGKATLYFRCRPERYIIEDEVEVSSGDVIENETNHVALPLIKLYGTGATSLLELEGKTVAHGSASAYFPINYLNSQISSRNTTVYRTRAVNGQPYMFYQIFDSGDSATFDDENGTLTYNIQTLYDDSSWGIGYCLEIEPNTPYTLSWEAYNGGSVTVYVAETTGNNLIRGSISGESSGSGWVAGNLSFTAPPECSYIFIIFSPVGSGTQQFRKIMLNSGKSALPFKPYEEPPQYGWGYAFKINTIQIQFNSVGFNEALIDCENENFTVDGKNNNRNCTVVDTQFFNTSSEYLRLDVGNNTITYSGDISSVKIDTRFWEL